MGIMSSDRLGTSLQYRQKEKGYRDMALKLYPWVCGRCAREFVFSNLKELTVHHIDHDHTNNPSDGSNWELLCIYCHDNEHAKYTDHANYKTEVVAGHSEHVAATHNPFADLKSLLKK
jgi:5-methylcytosine-specific restriction endonuclease McrA|tara:strand:- start:1481 stop:1834 length:354 start_codon:yes stop_codon:yes gene_type:complete